MATDWITTAQAAELSGYHPERIRELMREGRVEAQKFGTLWQVSRASLLAYLKASEKSEDKRRGPKPQDGW
jgi:excisionase family DNA binding protein